MHRGYIALWRKINDNPFYKEPRIFSKYEAWLDILKEAQHKENPQQVIIGMKTLICNYGECLKSNITWAKKWNWSESKVRRFLKLCEKLGQISIKNESITTRISITNYSIYDPKRRQRDDNVTRTRRGCDEDVTTDNNDKNVNNDKNTPPISPPGGSIGYNPVFLKFWSLYPRKVGKAKAAQSWKKIRNPSATLDKIKTALEWQIKSEQWTKDNGQYIPNPTTYLNQRRWEDEKPKNLKGERKWIV